MKNFGFGTNPKLSRARKIGFQQPGGINGACSADARRMDPYVVEWCQNVQILSFSMHSLFCRDQKRILSHGFLSDAWEAPIANDVQSSGVDVVYSHLIS